MPIIGVGGFHLGSVDSDEEATADFPFDTVQMPLNAFDATFRSFKQYGYPEVEKLPA